MSAAGKYLAIIAGVVTLVGTYLFAFTGTPPGDVASGLGFWQMLIQDATGMISNIISGLTIPEWSVYILIAAIFIFLISGILQFIGYKSRIVIILFSLFPLGFSVVLMINNFTDLLGPQTQFTLDFFGQPQLIEGIIPYAFDLGGLGLGAYLILAGGVLGIVSGILTREEFY